MSDLDDLDEIEAQNAMAPGNFKNRGKSAKARAKQNAYMNNFRAQRRKSNVRRNTVLSYRYRTPAPITLATKVTDV